MKNGTVAHLYDNQAHGDDACLTRELGKSSVLDAVLDGVSMGQGSVASQQAAKALEEGGGRSDKDILTILKKVNEALYRETDGISLTTITACLKIGDQLTVINSGDSPAYLIRNNQLTELTVMDKIPGDLVSLTNAVGIGSEFACHRKQIQLKAGDKLILVTDGISDNIDPDELLEITKAKTPEKAIGALKELLAQKQNTNKGREDRFGYFKPDDMTAIIRYL